jgi:hypothetical protein
MISARDPEQIALYRLRNQLLGDSEVKTVTEVARRLCALQAQDYAMSKWAFGLRIPGATETEINTAIDRGDIIRTHLLRPTWHFVAAEDLRWILDLTAPHIKSSMRFRDKQLGLTGKVISKCIDIIVKELENGNHRTRDELIRLLEQNGIDTGDNRPSHIFMRAELDGIICSGRQTKGKPSFALLDEWAPKATKKLTQEEALKKLAIRYFTGHGPATVDDFFWWSGLTVRNARLAVELARKELDSAEIGEKRYFAADLSIFSERKKDELLLLPAFDQFILGYRDRQASLALVHHKRAVSSNGIFYPVILMKGQAIGTWKRVKVKEMVNVSLNWFGKPGKNAVNGAEKALARYAEFTGKTVCLTP